MDKKSTPTNKENKPKSTNGEIELRINKVFDLLISGATRAQIIQYASEKAGWNITDRTIDEYISRANERILEIGKVHRDYEFSRSLARLNQLYFHGLTLQNHSVCLGIVKEINRMMGIGSVKTEIISTRSQTLDATLIAAEIVRLNTNNDGDSNNG